MIPNLPKSRKDLSAVFESLEVLMLLYRNGDLPSEQRAFAYYASPQHKKEEKVTWIHQTELQRYRALESTYPGAGIKRSQL